MITIVLDKLKKVKLLSTTKQNHVSTSLRANGEKVQLCIESTSLTSKGQSREVLVIKKYKERKKNCQHHTHH